MSEPRESHVRVGNERCRVWEKGDGEPLGFLGGLRGLPRWPAFLDHLAEERRVIAPSLPGFPGAVGHDRLDDLPDWVTATLDLLEASGLDGADLVGASVGATLAAEVDGECTEYLLNLKSQQSSSLPCGTCSANRNQTAGQA